MPTYIKRLQQTLDKYYTGEGKASRQLLSVHAGGKGAGGEGTNYLLQLSWRTVRPTQLFWAGHLALKPEILLVTNAPLFYRDRNAEYRIRVMAVNDEGTYRRHSQEERSPSLECCEECFHYVSIGDFRLAVALSSFFSGQGVGVDTRVVYSSRDHEDHRDPPDQVDMQKATNLIALGNRRVSWVVRALQEEMKPNFFIADQDHTRITNRKPQKGELEVYEDSLVLDGCIFAAVIRRTSRERVETLISVQNGPALEALAWSLMQDDEVAMIAEQAGWTTQYPENFELLFQIDLGKKEAVRRGRHPRLVASR